jgi:predicted TIM-barrel fold metal-dependent hydrolase
MATALEVMLKNCQKEIEQLRAENEAMKGLLRIARCPNVNCCDGIIAQQIGEDDWEPEQCQWCYERAQALKGASDGQGKD